jgi:hypothetical protein
MSNPLTDILSVGLAATTPKIIVSSNLAPDITIDLSKAMGPGASPATQNQAVSSEDTMLLRLIQPEIIITGLGLQKSIAPYGSPRADMIWVFVVGVLAMGLIGAGVTWSLCSRVGNN